MIALVVAFELTAVTATPKPIVFEVEPGWGAKRVATSLKEQGIIRSAPVFTLYLRWRGIERSIGEGFYDLSPSMDAAEVASALEKGGRPRTVKVVIPEGWRAIEIAARLEAAGLGSAVGFRALFTDPGSLRPAFVPSSDGLEGYLFPASYDLPQSGTPEDVVRTMLARFKEELDAPTREMLRVRRLSVHDWVTLASMVQAEAASPGEMPIIAGVFLNRLLSETFLPRQRLQADPTVSYGCRAEPSDRKSVV